MTREKENYLLSSLDEYLSILDSEGTSSRNVSVADSLAQIRPNSEPMSRSGMTNPISRSKSANSYMNGLIVKSGYNIESEKGFLFFQRFMKEQNILKELEEKGIQEGDTVKMYGHAFDYYK